MKITVTGSLGNISKPLIQKLTDNGHVVKVISSNPEKSKDIQTLNAIPLIGNLQDTAFVINAFKEADAVYTMVPPDFSVEDYLLFADAIHQNYQQAIQENNIQYAVNLSSIGVAKAGIAPLTRYYDLEHKLDEIPSLNVVHLRPAMFYTNFYGSIPLVKQQGILGHNLSANVDLIMTHPYDIAEAAFQYLHTCSFSGHQVKFVISDIKTGNDIAQMIGEAINKPIQWVEFPDEALLAGLLQNGFSRDAAETLVVAAGQAIREGLFDEFKKEEYKVKESRSFADFSKEFAQIYQFSH